MEYEDPTWLSKQFQEAVVVSLASCVLVTGCATPPALVSAKAPSAELSAQFASIECGRLAKLLEQDRSIEKHVTEDMAARATKQVVVNTIGIAAVALGGFGKYYFARGESSARDVLAEQRGNIEVMTKILAEKRCRPDGTGPDDIVEAYRAVERFVPEFSIDPNSAIGKEIADLGGADCTIHTAGSTPENLFRRGRLLTSLDQYRDGMRCLLRVVEQAPGTTVYRESCELIGVMYRNGWGVKQDAAVARLWMHKASL